MTCNKEGPVTTTTIKASAVPIQHQDRLFIDGQWVLPSSDAAFDVLDCATEELYYKAAEAQAADMDRAIAAARHAFDEGPWPRMAPTERAAYLAEMAAEMRKRSDDIGQLWSRQAGVLYRVSRNASEGLARTFDYYSDVASTFEWVEEAPSIHGGFGMLSREPVGVVGAIIPWNAPMRLICNKVPPALLAGCTVVLKASPEAPGEAYVMAEIADAVGLPPGVLNVLTADREVSELLVRDEGVDKITFTGSTAAGRKIASLCGDRVARFTLELGGKSPAVILDDADLGAAAETLAQAECFLAGQVCASLTRIIVTRSRHDQLVEALANSFSKVRLGSPFDEATEMGPLAMERQRDRVEGYIAKGLSEGATLATGGGRPAHLDRGWYVEPTVFGNVDNSSTIAQEEVFGPVLLVIAADDEDDAIRIANDTIYGLNAAVFTDDVDRALEVAGRIRSGTVGHNGYRLDIGIGVGGYKQSGIGREGGIDGLRTFLESKTIVLDTPPAKTRINEG
jgi:aldehyde dehydrogenase (NAD+)